MKIDLASALGSVLGFGGSLWQSSQNAASAEAMMNFQREVLQNKYQWAVQDMKAAGLNPLLAAMNGVSAGGATGAQYQATNPGQSAVNSAMAIRQLSMLERQQRNNDMVAKSQADLNSAKAFKEEADTLNARALFQSGFYGAQVNALESSAAQNYAQSEYYLDMKYKVKQDISESMARVSQIQENIGKLRSEISLLKSQKGNVEADTSLKASLKKLAGEEANLARWRSRVASKEEDLKKVEYVLKDLQRPEAENRAAYHQAPGNRAIERYVPNLGHKLFPFLIGR